MNPSYFSPGFLRFTAVCTFLSALTTFGVHLLPLLHPASGFEEQLQLANHPIYRFRLWVVILGGLANVLSARYADLLLPLFIASAMIGMAVRFFLISLATWDYVRTGIIHRQIFPLLFLLDEFWSIAPFGLSLRIGGIFALSCIPPLAFAPFAQRTCIESAYDTSAPRRRSTGSGGTRSF
jgi:hypothetical protein